MRRKAYEKQDHALPISKPISQFSDDDIKGGRDRRLETCSRGTALRGMTLISSVLETARIEWKWVAVNP